MGKVVGSSTNKKTSKIEETIDDLKNTWRGDIQLNKSINYPLNSHNYIDGIEDNKNVHPSQRADRIQENTLHKLSLIHI